MTDETWILGDRVRLSEKGKRIHVNTPDRKGAFVGLKNGFYIYVRWDGRKAIGHYHPDFIEKDL